MPDDLGSYHVPDPDQQPKRVTPVNFLNRIKETEAHHAAAAAAAKQEQSAQSAHDAQVQQAADQQAKQEAAAAAEADRHAKEAAHQAPTAQRPEHHGTPAQAATKTGSISRKSVFLVILGGLLLGGALIGGYEQFVREPAPVVVPTSAPVPATAVTPATTQVVPQSATTGVPSRGIPPAQE